jgi:hypothetical protein
MRKKINLFLFKKWPWAYRKLRQARIWFYKFQDDYGRAYDAMKEPSNFGAIPQKETPKVVFYDQDPRDLHDFHEFDKVFHEIER